VLKESIAEDYNYMLLYIKPPTKTTAPFRTVRRFSNKRNYSNVSPEDKVKIKILIYYLAKFFFILLLQYIDFRYHMIECPKCPAIELGKGMTQKPRIVENF
jgi:hypothetical protein